MTTWTCLHLYADEAGVSRVDPGYTIELSTQDFAPPATPMLVSRAPHARALTFLELPVGWLGGWHPSPTAQWVICLSGEMGYKAGDGTLFTLRAGSCIYTSDTRGTGHDSWNAGANPVRLVLMGV